MLFKDAIHISDGGHRSTSMEINILKVGPTEAPLELNKHNMASGGGGGDLIGGLPRKLLLHHRSRIKQHNSPNQESLTLCNLFFVP
jgi:hypothetical protein